MGHNPFQSRVGVNICMFARLSFAGFSSSCPDPAVSGQPCEGCLQNSADPHSSMEDVLKHNYKAGGSWPGIWEATHAQSLVHKR